MKRAGAEAEEGSDREDSMGVGCRKGTRGKREKGVLAVGKNGSVAKAVGGEGVEEELKAKADSIDLTEVVGAGAESSAEEDMLTRDGVSAGKEDEGPRAGWAWVRGG